EWRHHQPSFGDVDRGGHIAEAHQHSGFHRALEHARLDLSDRYFELAHRLAHRARLRATFIVKLSLLGDVFEIEWIGIGLIRVRRAVAHDDHVPAVAQGIAPFSLPPGVAAAAR